MKKSLIFFLSAFLFSSFVFAANERILQNPEQPYQSLGAIESKVPNKHGFVKFATFGLVQKRAYERMTRQLNKKLLKQARKKYGADAIANVTYWPAPDSGEAVDYLYGRAEMVRFKKFPISEKAVEVSLVEAQRPAAL